MSLGALLDAARVVASLGVWAGALLAAGGAALLVLGKPAFRPAAGVLSAAGTAFVAHVVVAKLEGRLPPLALTLAIAAVLGAALGLAVPRLATLAVSAAVGFILGGPLGALVGIDADVTRLGVGLTCAMVVGVFSTSLSAALPPVVGAALLGLGAWSLCAVLKVSDALFRLPAAWLGLFGVLAVVGLSLEPWREARRVRRGRRKAAKAEAAARRRRDAEERARYARYFE